MYGVYTTAIRKLMPSEEEDEEEVHAAAPSGTATPKPRRVSMSVFFGWLGLFNAALAAPVVGGLAWAGWERPAAFATPSFMGLVLLKGLLDNVISDVLWARAVVLTSPTLATVALSLTIPLAIVADALTGSAPPPGRLMSVGSLAVVAGFATVSLAVRHTQAAQTTPDSGSQAAADDDVVLRLSSADADVDTSAAVSAGRFTSPAARRTMSGAAAASDFPLDEDDDLEDDDDLAADNSSGPARQSLTSNGGQSNSKARHTKSLANLDMPP
jgi:hypothetical protein